LYPSGAILVRYTVQPAAVGADVILGMKMLVRVWFDYRVPFVQGGALQEVPFGISNLLAGGARRVFA
jgi:hypothetical protein